MKAKEFSKKNRKKLILCIVLSVIILAGVAAGLVYYFIFRSSDEELGFFWGGGNQGESSVTVSGSVISASGVTSVGTESESFDVENLTTSLEIEEVYVSSNDVVEEGTLILKLSEESVEEAREELEEALNDADLAYRAGVIEYAQSQITLEYEYNAAVLAGEQAQAVYDQTVSNLTSSLEQTKEKLEEAEEQIAEYESYVNDGSYWEYFQIDEYQAAYDETLELLMAKMEEWGVSWSEVTGSSGSMGGSFGSSGVDVSGGDSSTYNQYVSILQSLYSVLEDNMADLTQAQSDYEDAVANASFELQTLQLQLPSLKQAVSEAEENYETQLLQAQLTYETTLASAERAESDYETSLEKALADYEDLEETYEDAKENLELFESCVGDGYYYATGSGTILRTMVNTGGYLTSGSTILTYSDTSSITVTVSVDQSDIAEISVGDEVTVLTSDSEVCEGTVTGVNPVTASSSRISVTYSVTVALSGDTSGLSANQSVTVYFGTVSVDTTGGGSMDGAGAQDGTVSGDMTGEGSDDADGIGLPDGKMPDGGEMTEDGGMPEGFTMPETDGTSDGFTMPEDGEMPDGASMPDGFTVPDSDITGTEEQEGE